MDKSREVLAKTCVVAKNTTYNLLISRFFVYISLGLDPTCGVFVDESYLTTTPARNFEQVTSLWSTALLNGIALLV